MLTSSHQYHMDRYNSMDTSGVQVSKCKECYCSLYRSLYQCKTMKFYIPNLIYQFPLTSNLIHEYRKLGVQFSLEVPHFSLENPIQSFFVFLSLNSAIKTILGSCLLWEAASKCMNYYPMLCVNYFYSHTSDTKCVDLFFAPTNSPTYWIPTGCSRIQPSSDTNSPDLVQTSPVKGSVL